MAFVVEDGTGKTDANAGVSVEFADQYHEDRGNTSWSLFTKTVKEQLIVKATDYTRDVYGQALSGVRTFADQGIDFPRVGMKVNGFALPLLSVPRLYQEVVAELALTAKTAPLLVNVTRGKKMVKVGPLQVEYDGTSSVQTKFVAASLRMAALLTSAQSSGINVPLRRV